MHFSTLFPTVIKWQHVDSGISYLCARETHLFPLSDKWKSDVKILFQTQPCASWSHDSYLYIPMHHSDVVLKKLAKVYIKSDNLSYGKPIINTHKQMLIDTLLSHALLMHDREPCFLQSVTPHNVLLAKMFQSLPNSFSPYKHSWIC